MFRFNAIGFVLASFLTLGRLSSIAAAQSTVSGQVRDSSGAVMAGVKVEATSPALIEGSRSAITNGEGRYAIVDVRLGTYTDADVKRGAETIALARPVPGSRRSSISWTWESGILPHSRKVHTDRRSTILQRHEIECRPHRELHAGKQNRTWPGAGWCADGDSEPRMVRLNLQCKF
jgi:hypothetical protein